MCTRLRDGTIIISISCFLILLTEFSLRAIFPEKVLKTSQIAFQHNDNHIVALTPNVTKKYVRKRKNGGYHVQWRANSDGFRGAELQSNPESRIVVYGDSNVQARFSGVDRTFPSQLSTILTFETQKNVEVINAGVVGFGPDQALLRIKSEIDNYKPDLIILNIFADNDYGDIIRNRLYELDDNGDLKRTSFKTKHDSYLLELEDERNSLNAFFSNTVTIRGLKRMLGILNTNSADTSEDVIDTTSSRIKQLIIRSQDEYQVYTNNEPRKYSSFDDQYDIDIALYPTQRSSQTKKLLLSKILENTLALADSKNVKFLVVIQPSVIDLTKNDEYLNYEQLSHYPDYLPQNLTNPIVNSCNLNDITCINLYEIFSKYNPEFMYFSAGDNHWSDFGQYVTAKETAKLILEKEMLK